MAFLDGEADQNTTLHLQKCPYCRNRVDDLAHEQNLLTSRLFRVSCPPATELGEYHLRMLAPDRMLMVSQHLRECPHCTQEIEQLDEFLSDLAPGTESNLFEQAKVLVAQMVSGRGGSGVKGEPSFALRGGGEDPILFETDGIVIVLDIQPSDGGKMNILGQVAADDQERWTGATVTLQPTGGLEKMVFLDDLGAFRFEEALSDSIRITITSPHGVEVQIPRIDIDV